MKDVWVELKQLLGHAVQGDLTNLPLQLHLKEIKEHQHIGPNVEKGHGTLKALSIEKDDGTQQTKKGVNWFSKQNKLLKPVTKTSFVQILS